MDDKVKGLLQTVLDACKAFEKETDLRYDAKTDEYLTNRDFDDVFWSPREILDSMMTLIDNLEYELLAKG